MPSTVHCGSPSIAARRPLQLAVFYAVAAASTVFAWLGMQSFRGSRYVAGVLPITMTTTEFAGLVSFIVLGPTALSLFVAVVSNVAAARNALHPAVRLAFAVLHAALFAVLASVAYSWGGYELLQCGIVGCVGDVGKSKYPDGWIPWVGVALVVVSAPLASVCALLSASAMSELVKVVWRRQATKPSDANDLTANMLGGATSTRRDEDASSSAHASARRAVQLRMRARRWGVAVFLLVLMPLLFFASSTFPSGWRHWTAPAGALYASRSYSTPSNQTLCELPDSCPEFAGAPAFFRTTSLRLTDAVALKLYPDTRTYYAALWLATLVGIACTHSPSLHRALHRRWPLPTPLRWLPLPGAVHGAVSAGALLASAGLLLLFGVQTAYWFGAHDFGHHAKPAPARWARAFGQMGNLLLGLLALPVARNSVWAEALGVPWEVGISVHKVLGYTFLAVGLAHMGCWWAAYKGAGTFPHDIYAAPTYWPLDGKPINPRGSDDFSVPLMTWVFYTALVVFGGLALNVVRRRRYELFYYSHHFALVVYVAALWHAASAWYYVTPSIVLYACDRLLRLRAATRETRLVRLAATGDVTELAFTTPRGPLRGTAGQYAFLNVPALSPLQWHPFTISSAPADAAATLHVKAMGGADSFTSRLNALAREMETAGTPAAELTVRMDGPFGVPPDASHYDLLVLVAGGIGVTPCHAILRQLHSSAMLAQKEGKEKAGSGGTCAAQLVWSLRDEHMPSLFEPTFRAIDSDDAGGRFGYSLHLTSGGKPKDLPSVMLEVPETPTSPSAAGLGAAEAAEEPLKLESGRPDLPSLLHHYRRQAAEASQSPALAPLSASAASPAPLVPPNRVLVFACGPEAMVRAASDAALAVGAHFHAETFEL